MKVFYNIFQKYMYFIALIAVVLTIYTMYDYKQIENVDAEDKGIQSFVIRTFDNSFYISSTDELYCRFLDKYGSSFTVNGEISEKEIVTDKYNGMLEFTTDNGEDYLVYIQLSEPVYNENQNRFCGLFDYVTPTVVSVNSVSNSNMYIYNSTYSKGLIEFLMKLKNS